MSEKVLSGYSPVIGDPDVYVKRGTFDELLYFKVKPSAELNKIFYLTPSHYPGYNDLIESDYGRYVVKEWEKNVEKYMYVRNRKNLQSDYVNVPKNIIIK